MKPEIIKRSGGGQVAYHYLPGTSPGVMFCGGLMSDMTGTKALALEEHCRSTGRGYLRFDYQGHGQSSGLFQETTVGDWKGDAVALLDEVAQSPQVIVGSSMGGWIMLLLALARPERVKGLVGIAAAPDFVNAMWEELSPGARDVLARDGVYARPSEYGDDPYMISMNLIEEGRNHLLLDKPIPISCPVRLLHGMEDPDVPWELSLELSRQLQSDDVTVTLVKHGDHRLSTPSDIERLVHQVDSMT
jgi:pimeloyl-ACP methyl ester carboxylesterase